MKDDKKRMRAFPYNVILDELLVTQEDLLPAEDGGLGPGVEGSGAGVHSCQHLLLGSLGNSSHHLISGLRSRRQSIPDMMTESRGSHYLVLLHYMNSLILITK